MRLMRDLVGMNVAMLARDHLVRRNIDTARKRHAKSARRAIPDAGKDVAVPEPLNLLALRKPAETKLVLLVMQRIVKIPVGLVFHPRQQRVGKRLAVELRR